MRRLSFLLEGLRLKGCGCQSISTHSNHVKSDLLVWWVWFLFDGFGCQSLKKYSNLADSCHFNAIILIFWFGDFDSFWTGLGCQSLKSFQFGSSGLVSLITLGQVLAAKAWKRIQIWQCDNSAFLVWWLWFLLDRFWPSKLEKVIKSGCWCVGFHSFLKDCGWRVAGAKASAPIQTTSNLIFWFGEFDSFLTGFGCQAWKSIQIFFKLWQPKPAQ